MNVIFPPNLINLNNYRQQVKTNLTSPNFKSNCQYNGLTPAQTLAFRAQIFPNQDATRFLVQEIDTSALRNILNSCQSCKTIPGDENLLLVQLLNTLDIVYKEFLSKYHLSYGEFNKRISQIKLEAEAKKRGLSSDNPETRRFIPSDLGRHDYLVFEKGNFTEYYKNAEYVTSIDGIKADRVIYFNENGEVQKIIDKFREDRNHLWETLEFTNGKPNHYSGLGYDILFDENGIITKYTEDTNGHAIDFNNGQPTKIFTKRFPTGDRKKRDVTGVKYSISYENGGSKTRNQ